MKTKDKQENAIETRSVLLEETKQKIKMSTIKFKLWFCPSVGKAPDKIRTSKN
jgi:hypothetical protein